ncbi:unnamed protein product [Durusdinium trenchii]
MLLEASCGNLERCFRLLDAALECNLLLDGASFGILAGACRRQQVHQAPLLERFVRCYRRSPAMAGLAQAPAPHFEDLPPVQAGHSYAKELMLLQHVRTSASRNASAVCRAMEQFGREKLPSSSKWLKIAGGPKAELLSSAVASSPKGLALELGTYCGFSALHLSCHRKVVTVEADLGHALIAEKVIAFAGMSQEVEVIVGHTEDTLPWLMQHLAAKEPGEPLIGFVFMDQRGSRYQSDLEILKCSKLLMDQAVIVADNVLKPGAPKFLWALSNDPAFRTEVIELEEYAMENVRDWMTISTYCQPAGPDRAFECTLLPKQIQTLEWRAEMMRNRSHRPQHGGSGVDHRHFR